MPRMIFLAACLVLGQAFFGFADGPVGKPEIRPFTPIPAHDFDGADGWLNSKPLSIRDLRGRVAVIHFWSFNGGNCIPNLPHYNQWQKDFAEEPFTIVGIHSPQTEEESFVENLRRSIELRGISYPVVVDHSGELFKRWRVSMWPTCGIVDKQGMLRYYWEGELNWKEQKGEAYMREKIKELLAEKTERNTKPAVRARSQ